MINLKMSPDEAKHEYGETALPQEIEQPKYPYGTSIYLDEMVMKKLGMENLPEVGSEMTLMAKVKVVSVSERERLGGEKCKNVDLQITEMEFGAPQATRTDTERANTLYSGQ